MVDDTQVSVGDTVVATVTPGMIEPADVQAPDNDNAVEPSAETALAKAREASGRLHTLVHNFGSVVDAPLAEIEAVLADIKHWLGFLN